MKLNTKVTIEESDTARDIFEKILLSRGIASKQEIKDFLKPTYPDLKTLPRSLKIELDDLKSAKEIIDSAIKNKKNILIYGDYDADGITSTAILWKTLNHLGAKVLPFIPNRKTHGYGLSKKGIKAIFSKSTFKNSPIKNFKPELVITTDNGIVAQEEIAMLKEKGVDVILTDHHQSEKSIPMADTIIHSTETSAAGIAWLISLYLTKESEYSKNMIDLATIGIVADQIPLKGINRTIVTHGLTYLSKTQNPGLKSLIETSKITGKELSTYDINFALAPRINAMGRLSDGTESLRLLCTNSKKLANTIAQTMEDTNRERQDITYSAIEHSKKSIGDEKLVIVASDTYHEGVVGLIAGKLVEETGKPAIAISTAGKVAKGSARSIKGINITNLIKTHKNLLVSAGGHEMAAGFSLKLENLEKFKSKILETANNSITDDMLIKEIRVDAKLSLPQTTKQLEQLIESLAPFGIGNPKPKFYTNNLSILEHRELGSNKEHLKFTVEQSGTSREAIWFRYPEIDPNEISQLVFQLSINRWRDKETLQLIVNYGK